MNNSKSNFYRLSSLVLISLGVFAFVSDKSTQANSSYQTQPVAAAPSSRSRHKITLNLTDLSNLKVTEGQRVEVGDIISDRSSERAKLSAKKQKLTEAIARAKLPLNSFKSMPEPSFESELVNLKQAQFNLDVIVQRVNNFDSKFYHKDPWHVQVFESEKVQQLADLKRQELTASLNVEKAIARLDEAKLNYQKQQYEHSLKVSDYQVLITRKQEQVLSLQSQLDKLNQELESLTSVYSPYRGKVRRVKILGQNERSITAEVTLDIRSEK